MAMTLIGKSIWAFIILGGGAVTYSVMNANSKSEKSFNSQQEKVGYVADSMRDMQSLPGSASNAEIDNWETQMKRIVDPENQKIGLCQLYTTQASMLAMVEQVANQSGNQEMIADVADDIRNIPPGSLEDWLFQTARGGARPKEFVNNECLQQPTVHVLNPGVRRNSQEMRDLQEECLASGTC